MGFGAGLGDEEEAVLISQGENLSELAFEGAHLDGQDARDRLVELLEEKASRD